jgi:hypothetical protein
MRTHRTLLTTALGAALVLALPSGRALGAGEAKSTIVVARDPRAIDERNHADAVRVARMFDRALLTFTGEGTAAEAWKRLGLIATDVVAIKVNCNDWTIRLSPHPELVGALTRSLATVIPENQIIVYERRTADLKNAGFTPNKSPVGVRFFGNDDGGGYDPAQRLTNIVAKTATKIINLASLKAVDGDGVIAKLTNMVVGGSSDGFGLSCFLKNHVGTLVDDDMSKCHTNPDMLAEIASRPAIRDKTMLVVADGLRATYRRGVPWYWAGIILGKDPVAAETVAFQVVNEKRVAEGVAPLALPGHVRTADVTYHLGTSDAARITRIDLAPAD